MVEKTLEWPLPISYVPPQDYITKPSLYSAALALPSQWSRNPAANDEEELLVNSPYTSQRHLLRLGSIGKPQQLLAKALTVMTPLLEDYATASYADSFNWSLVAKNLKSLVETQNYAWKRQSFYIVVFRSRVPQTTDRSYLAALDKRSHAEAMESGGLLKYWFGTPDVNGRNIATCNSQSKINAFERSR